MIKGVEEEEEGGAATAAAFEAPAVDRAVPILGGDLRAIPGVPAVFDADMAVVGAIDDVEGALVPPADKACAPTPPRAADRALAAMPANI